MKKYSVLSSSAFSKSMVVKLNNGSELYIKVPHSIDRALARVTYPASIADGSFNQIVKMALIFDASKSRHGYIFIKTKGSASSLVGSDVLLKLGRTKAHGVVSACGPNGTTPGNAPPIPPDAISATAVLVIKKPHARKFIRKDY